MTQRTTRTVLIVDDNHQLRDWFSAIAARDATIETQFAANIEHAQEILRRWAADLVVLDLLLPDVTDPIESVRIIRALNAGADVAIIAISGDEGLRAASLEAGADEFRLKPLKSDEILYLMQTVVHRKKAAEIREEIKKELAQPVTNGAKSVDD